MNGCTIPYTPIAVDFWKVRQCQRVRLFFLSHAHLDQTCGITSSWSMPIYCSPISKILLLQRFQLNEDIVHSLELNVRHVIPITSKKDVTMTVTLIDANHCPGSVMFLFEGYFGRILYTGDFRYTESMLTTFPFADIISKPIDVLYMDNTYCSPKCTFPPREAAEKEILSIIEQHPNEKIIIGLRNLGKEDLLIAIALRFGLTIKVADERYKTLELLNASSQFTMTDDDCRIQVVPMMQITRQNLDAWNAERPTVAILPTALFTALGYLPFHGQKDTIVVPYSDHSSYLELHKFVASVKPKSIIPIVKADVRDPLTAALLDRTSVECFLEYLDKTPMTNYHIPAAVLELMNQTVSRTGSGRKVAATRKLEKLAKIPKSNAKCKVNKTPAASKSDQNTVTDSSNSKSKDILEANCSKTALPESGSMQVCKPESSSSNHQQRQNALELMQPVKSNGFNTRLVKCVSSDRLHSLNFRPHARLRAAHISSPNLRMPLKRKATSDLKRIYLGTNSNLVRTRRMRLCNVHLCRTLCHGSKDCDGMTSDDCDSDLEHREQILEVNRGEETMYYFTDDILNEFRAAKMKRNGFDAISNVEDSRASSCAPSLDLSARDGQKDGGERLPMNDSRSTAGDVVPSFIQRHSPVTPDSLTACNRSLSRYSYSPAVDEPSSIAIDLSSSRPAPSGLPPRCSVVTDTTTPRVCMSGELSRAFSRTGHHCGNRAAADLVSINQKREAVSELNYLHGLSLSSAPPPRELCMAMPTVAMSLTDPIRQLYNGSRSHLPINGYSNSWQSSLLSSSLIFSQVFPKNASEAIAESKVGQGFEATSIDGRRRLDISPYLSDSPEDLTQRSPFNQATNFVTLSADVSANQYRPIQNVVQGQVIVDSGVALDDARRSALATNCKLDGDNVPSGYDCVDDPTDCMNPVDSAEHFELKTTKDNSGKKSVAGNVMALHSANPTPENKLPPKKNWRSRFRMAQLHKGHQENKWMKLEPNGASTLLVSNGNAGNSCDL